MQKRNENSGQTPAEVSALSTSPPYGCSLKKLPDEIRIGKLRIRCADLVFLIAFGAVAAFFILNAPYGITDSDESMYQFFCYRLVKGDHLFAHDWVFCDMVAFFTYLPYRVFTALLGGTEGLLLTLRYFYVAIKLVFFVFLYCSIREFRYWAVLAAILFVGTDIFGFKTNSYYTVCLYAVLLTGVILFIKKRQSPFLQFAAGFIFSWGVVAEPPIAVVWAGYTVLILIRYITEKKGKTVFSAYDFIIDPVIWRRMLYGILTAAAIFIFLLLFVFMGTDWNAIGIGLGKMLTYFDAIGVSRGKLLLEKIVMYVRLYHPVLFGSFAVVFVAAVPLHRLTKKIERPLFALLAVLYICTSVRLITLPFSSLEDASGECVSHPLGLSLLAVAAYMFTKEKNKRLFAFLVTTFVISVAADISSLNLFGSLLLAASAPAVLLLRDYVLEQWTLLTIERKNTKRISAAGSNKKAQMNATDTPAYRTARKAFAAALCALIFFIPSFEVWHFWYMGHFHQIERVFCQSNDPLDTRIESGLLKGIVTIKALADNYAKSVSDAERIAGICKNGLIVVDYDTAVYFNADVRVATYGMHVTLNNWEPEETWWRLYPERKPDVAYVPYFTLSYGGMGTVSPQEKLSYFKRFADTSIIEGEIGYIVQLSNWNLPEAAE